MAHIIVDHTPDAQGPWILTAWKPEPGQIIAICDRCSAMIGRPMAVKNSAGRVLTVGSDRATALFLTDSHEARRQQQLDKVAAADRAHDKALRQARDARKLSEIKAILGDAQKCQILAGQPHPNPHRAKQGETLLSWAQWMQRASGAAGRARVLKAITAALN